MDQLTIPVARALSKPIQLLGFTIEDLSLIAITSAPCMGLMLVALKIWRVTWPLVCGVLPLLITVLIVVKKKKQQPNLRSECFFWLSTRGVFFKTKDLRKENR